MPSLGTFARGKECDRQDGVAEKMSGRFPRGNPFDLAGGSDFVDSYSQRNVVRCPDGIRTDRSRIPAGYLPCVPDLAPGSSFVTAGTADNPVDAVN